MSGQVGMFDDVFVDSFAGGGGASTGIELATGHPIDIAINHDESAILMHRRNHPFTEHYREDIWLVDPVKAVRGRHVRLAWFSPDCKHFSRAKGAALVDKNIRGLAWVVLRWAGLVRPDVIMLENVPEFVTWGPIRKGKPIKSKSGQTYQKWRGQLEALGYKIETSNLCAADYGAPTIRTRFCLIARCDGKPIVFPKPTHAPRNSPEVLSGKLKPWRAAAEVIDFSLPCYSIFESKETIKAKHGVNVKRPLAENTLKRIARGLDKFVIRSAEPFIVPIGYGEAKGQTPRIHDINEPLSTVVSSTKQYVCNPVVSPYGMTNNAGNAPHDPRDPIPTITTGNRVYNCEPVLTPFIAQQKFGNEPQNVREPLTTITSVGAHEVVSPCLVQYHTEQSENVRGQNVADPLMTVDASNRYGLAAMHLTQYFSGEGHYHSVQEPLATITTMEREGVTAAYLSKYYSGVDGAEISEPLPTVTAIDHNSVALAHLAHFKGKDKGQNPRDPLMSITACDGQFAQITTKVVKWDGQADLGYWSEVRAMLNAYCDYHLSDDDVLLMNICGAWYFISDIGLRMLVPRELYDAMGFPHDYIIDKYADGTPISRADQVARCGNAVCPAISEAMTRANLPECCKKKITKMDELHEYMCS